MFMEANIGEKDDQMKILNSELSSLRELDALKQQESHLIK